MVKNKRITSDHPPSGFGDGGIISDNNKEIYLFGEINPMSTAVFLSALNEADRTPGAITIYICSAGGWVEGGLAMYDAVKTTANIVTTVACGAVYSSAILPFVAGDVRLTHASATFLLHQMSLGMSEVNLTTVRSVTAETARLYRLYCDYVADSSKLTAEAVALACQRDTYLDALEAARRGIAQKVIEYTKKKFIVPNKKSRK